MSPFDVGEARRYTECSDCDQGLYVYDSRGYPSDTGAICFDCLRKRYEALRDAAPGPETQRVLDAVAAALGERVDDPREVIVVAVTLDRAGRAAFLAERKGE